MPTITVREPMTWTRASPHVTPGTSPARVQAPPGARTASPVRLRPALTASHVRTPLPAAPNWSPVGASAPPSDTGEAVQPGAALAGAAARRHSAIASHVDGLHGH